MNKDNDKLKRLKEVLEETHDEGFKKSIEDKINVLRDNKTITK